jgi:hypothetical protein
LQELCGGRVSLIIFSQEISSIIFASEIISLACHSSEGVDVVLGDGNERGKMKSIKQLQQYSIDIYTLRNTSFFTGLWDEFEKEPSVRYPKLGKAIHAIDRGIHI